MFTQVLTAAITGVNASIIRVEADVSDGLPAFSIVGYASTQVKEAQDRVRTAVRNIGLALPPKRITINLAPADIRKEGSRFDLPIAAAILAAARRVPEKAFHKTLVIGELGLDGSICPVNGVLSSVVAAREEGCKICILPFKNLAEARNVSGMRMVGLRSLEQLLVYCADPDAYVQEEAESESLQQEQKTPDFSDIQGQELVKRAAVLCAAGFHHMLMIGPPGSGKTMIASRLPALLPEMTEEECLEVTQIYSVAGLLPEGEALIRRRPFRAPHHTVSAQALAGGGRWPHPGEITLAHRGVLFLDEMPEFSRRSLEILRQPLEDKQIIISRSQGTVCFPADFLLVTAMNPCRCGYYPDMNRCSCSARDIDSYIHRISQPMLDRMDLCVEVPALSYEELEKKGAGPDTAAMREQVMRAVLMQRKRYSGEGTVLYNSRLSPADLKKYCVMTAEAEGLLKEMYRKLGLSARTCHRVIKVARTAADLSGEETIQKEHILEACCYRNADKKFWNR